ncbi:Glycosyltransferase GlyG [Anaerolineae bacterium]|nr:Glycosyltransferase GlyG [Anaerolineae bacterium]
MPPKLSVCIPTYNRLSELKICLEFLLPQVVVLLAGSVEIVIVNNASTDGTAEFIDTLPCQYSFVQVFHNSANLGFDGNTARCIEYAAGEYMALLSDDDVYLEGQVQAILDVVSRGDYALLALNYYSFIRQVHRPYKTYAPEEDVSFGQARDLINYLTVGHFSGLIYRSSLAKEKLNQTLDRAPLTQTDRSRGIYFEVALRLAYAADLPAYFIGRRRLAVKIPDSVDYAEIQNIAVDNCRFYTRLFKENVISAADLAYRYRLVIALLPQLTIRCTPGMSVAEIERVTRELTGYLGNNRNFRRKCLPLLRVAQYRPVRWLYKNSYAAARYLKRKIKGEP